MLHIFWTKLGNFDYSEQYAMQLLSQSLRKLVKTHDALVTSYFSVSSQRSNSDWKKNIPKMAAYVGKYDRISAENYDEFLSELGVNFLLRKAATASSPVFEVC